MHEWQGEEYLDDRLFILNLRLATKGNDEVWVLTTTRNVRGVPSRRVDQFENKDDAVAYLKLVEPETPRISLNGESPHPAPTYEEHLAWCRSEGILDAMQLHEVSNDKPRVKLVIHELTPEELAS